MNRTTILFLGTLVGLLFGAGAVAYLTLNYPLFLDRWTGTATLLAVTAATGGLLAFLFGLPRRSWGVPLAASVFGGLTAVTALLLALPRANGAPADGLSETLLSLMREYHPATVVVAAAFVGAFLTLLVAAFLQQRRWFAAACLVPALGLLSVPLLASRPAPPAFDSARPRTLVFGLDAGTWTILNEQFAIGELPNLQLLQEQGTSGVLMSEYASLSPRVWTSIATGKNPGKHGVLDFWATQNEDLKVPRVWEILHSTGFSVGLFQWLVTWPPDPLDPFVIPGWMARGPETHPGRYSFVKELEISFQTGAVEHALHEGVLGPLLVFRGWALGYLEGGLRFSTCEKILKLLVRDVWWDASWEKDYAAKRNIQLLLNGDLFLELYRTTAPDFGAMILYGTDNLAHKFWQYHFPEDFGIDPQDAEPFRDLLVDYYRAADHLLGEILEIAGEDTTVAVVSDHGFSSFDQGSDSVPGEQLELKPRMEALVKLAGMSTEGSVSNVATRGYFTPLGGTEEERRGVAQRLRGFLDSLTTPVGEPVFKTRPVEAEQLEIALLSSIYGNQPEKLATPRGKVDFRSLVEVERRAGDHAREGIVLLRGPGILAGKKIEGATLVDVAPTLLYLMGQPVGRDMDGAVLFEALDPELVKRRPQKWVESYDDLVTMQRQPVTAEDRASMTEYLESLGYIGDK